MAHDVFISHSVEDKPTADAVCATPEARNMRCWVAPRDVLPGEDYAEAMVEAIGKSRLMVLVFSSHSNKSPHVMREVERAASRGIPILPLRIEDVSPSKSMEYFISRTHWLDALTAPLKKHLQQLAETVMVLLARTGKPAELAEEPHAAPAGEAMATAVGAEPRVRVSERAEGTAPPRAPGLVRPTIGVGAVAFSLDWLLAALATIVAYSLGTIPSAATGAIEESEFYAEDILWVLPLLLTAPFYYWISNSLGGGPGKRILRLAIVRHERGQSLPPSGEEARRMRPGWRQGCVRTVMAILSVVALGLGYLWALWDEERKTWHDRAAGTLVVRVQ